MQHIIGSTSTSQDGVLVMKSVTEICQQVLQDNNRSLILDVFADVASLIKAPLTDHYRTLMERLQSASISHIKHLAKKSHFACFRNQSLVFIKSLVDLGQLNCISIPSQRFGTHLHNLKARLGLQHFEFMQYLGFLEQLPSHEGLYQQVITLTPVGQVYTAPLQQVQQALGELLSEAMSQQDIELSITQMTQA